MVSKRFFKQVRKRTNYLRVRRFLRTLSMAPLIASAAIVAVLALPAQLTDLYLGLWQDFWPLDLVRNLLSLGAALLLGSLLSQWHFSLANRRIAEVYGQYPDLGFYQNLKSLRICQALLLSAAPAIGVVLGAIGAFEQVDKTCGNLDAARSALGQSAGAAGWLSGLAPDCSIMLGSMRWADSKLAVVLTVMVGATLVRLAILWRQRESIHRDRPMRMLVGAFLLAGVVVLGPILPVRGFADPGIHLVVSIAWLIGPMVGIFVVLIAAVVLVMGISWLSEWSQVPIFFLLFLLAAWFAVEGIHSAIQVEARPAAAALASRKDKDSVGFDEVFAGWLDKRKTAQSPKRYPVYIVAAEGGGIYAASAAALFLATMQDQCSDFARHVFAISGVSGGAVGATVFDAALQTPVATDCNPSVSPARPLTERIDRVMSSDHLSPVLSFVLPDIASKLDPFLSTKLDRATALQSSFECAFAASVALPGIMPTCRLSDPGPNAIKRTFGSYWSNTQETAPALVLNTTSVDTGFRIAFAPDGMPLRSVGDGTLYAFSDLAAPSDQITMIEAAVASASFPLMQPPYSVQFKPDKRTMNFVDGGYIDNSGTSTALDMYKKLQASRASSGADLHLIVLTDTPPEVDISRVGSTGLIEMISPLAALLKVRAQMSDRALKATDELFRGPTAQDDLARHLHYIELDQRSVALPLGWKISRTELDYVRLLLGNPASCPPGATQYKGVLDTIARNSCETRHILEALAGHGWAAP